MKINKYDYYKIIQSNYGYGWEDEDPHPCDSSGYMAKADRGNLKENLRLYRENGGGSYRVIFRKELKAA